MEDFLMLVLFAFGGSLMYRKGRRDEQEETDQQRCKQHRRRQQR